MVHALSCGLEAGYSRVLIAGSDAPTLPSEYLHQLLEFDADVAFGPAVDGGFYAVSARCVKPVMFDTVTWSRPDTLEQTLSSVRRCGLSAILGAEWFDIDEPPDLDRLWAAETLPAHTSACLARIKAQRGSA
jgi:uncharacterized protein